MEHLELSEAELDKISKLASDRKFDYDKKIIYAESDLSLIKNFIKSYQFLFNLMEGVKKSEEKIYIKISDYGKQYDEIYTKCQDFLFHLSSSVEYGKSFYTRNLHDFLSENRDKLSDFINIIFPIGKKVSMYNSVEGVSIE